jgi:hypothetical protein
VARGRPTPIFTVDFREFLTHTLDIARPEAGANLVTDPRSIDGVHVWTLWLKRTMDQGSVLVVGKVINKITFQPEIVPLIFKFIDRKSGTRSYPCQR